MGELTGELKLLEFVAICAKVQDMPTTVSIRGDLVVGNNQIISTLRVGNASTLQLNHGGDMFVGSNSIVRISKGGKIHTTSGSKLYLRAGSKLIIENGGLFEHFGEIVAEMNTSIVILDGGLMQYKSTIPISFNNNLIFEIAGKLDVYSVLDFNGQGSIVFSTRNNVQPQIDVQSGAQFKVSGLTSYQSKINVSDNCKVQIRTFGTGSTNLTVGTIYLGKNANIQLYGNMAIAHIKFNSRSGSEKQGNGIIMYPVQNFTLLNTDFENLEYGLDLVLTTSPSIKSIVSCEFKNNNRGLKVTDKGFLLYNCNFENNTNTALTIEGMNMHSQINSCTFTNINETGYGVINRGAFQGLVKLNNSVVSGFAYGITCEIGRIILNSSVVKNNTMALNAVVGSIEATCSEIKNNVVGVYVLENGRFRTNIGAKNRIHSNDIAFFGDGGQIIIFSGENYVTNNAYNFGGITSSWNLMTPQTLFHSQLQPYDYFTLNVNRNDIDYLFEPYIVNNVLYGTQQSLGALSFTALNFTLSPNGIIVSSDPTDFKEVYPKTFSSFSYSPCPPTGVIVTPYSHIEGLSTGSNPTNVVINNNYFINVELKDAIREAASHMTLDMEFPNEDSLAILKLTSILINPNVLYSGETLELIGHVQTLMSEAVSNSISLGMVQVGEIQPLDSRIVELINSIYEYIDAVSSYEDERHIAFKLLEILNLYRVSGHYDECMRMLANETRLSSLPGGVFDFWNCLISNEYRLIAQEISLEEFVQANASCNSLLMLRKERSNLQKALDIIGSKKNISKNLMAFPNPTNSIIELRYTKSSNRILGVNIFTVTGVIIDELKSSDASNNFVLDMSLVPSGLYVLEVIDEYGNRDRIRIIKQ